MLSMDIGSKKVSIVEGSYQKGRVRITGAGEAEYKEDVVDNGEIKDRSTLEFIIKEIIKSHNFKSRQAVVTINSSEIISRELRLPNVRIADLEQMVRSEMLKYVGGESQFAIDFVINGPAPDNLLSVTAYVMSHDMVHSYFTLLQGCRLTPVALDVHANSISKLVSGAVINNKPAEANLMLADIGYQRLNFHGFTGGAFRFTRTELSPVQDLVRELGALVRADSPRALLESLNLTPGAAQESALVSDVCRYFLMRLSNEINKYCQYVMMNSAEKQYPIIYLLGGVAQIKGLADALSESLRTPVALLRTLDRVQLPAGHRLASYCNAAGALIRKG